MRPRRDPVPRAREAWWWLGGLFTLGLAAAGMVAAGVALWESIDIRQLAPALQASPPPLPEPPLLPASAKAGAGFSAVLFDSEPNRSYFPDPGFYPTELARWRELTEQVGGSVRVVSEAGGLRSVRADELLLLPEAPCLGADERTAIGRHLARGGSLVANWALGVRTRDCEWRGWRTLLEVTGAEAIRELTRRAALYLTVPAGLPTSPGIDPGTRIELRPDPAIALRVPGERVYWSDWALNRAPDDEGVGADVAVSTTRSDAGGRIAWFGVRASQAATAADSARLERLLGNGIRWAGGAPHAAAAPWPGGARSALAFVLDVEGRRTTGSARHVAEMFRDEGLPITFFVVSELVRDDEGLAEALVSAGEVGTQTVDHQPLAGQTDQSQAVRLQRSWSEIERWTGVGPEGLRPPEETFDAATMSAWKAAGGSYVLAGTEVRSAAPEIHRTDAGPIVVVPRVVKDDYTIVVRDITLRSRKLADALLDGTRKIRAIGGVAAVVGHTQIIEPGPRLEALRTVADSVRAQGGWWIAEGRQIARWWLDRSRVALEWVPAEGEAVEGEAADGEAAEDLLVWLRSEAEVEAGAGSDADAGSDVDAGAAIEGLWIDVVAAELAGVSMPLVDGVSVDFIEEPWGMRVAVGTVRAGEVRRISFVKLARETQ